MSLRLDIHLLEAVFDSISNEVQILEAMRDRDGRVIDFRYIMGTKAAYGGADDLAGKSVLSVYPWKKDKGIFDGFVKVVENGRPFEVIVDHDHRWYHIRARKFNDGMVLMREDVTVEKQAEEKIMQLNRALFSKNRQLETITSELRTFTSIAANDYNETLKTLYNSMEFIITNDARNLSDAGKANIRRAQASIQKMKLLTEDIVAFSKISSDEQMVPVDLNEILRVVLTGLDEKIRAENANIRSDNLPVVFGYSHLLSLLFYHLINNAVKFRKQDLAPVIELRYSIQPGSGIEHSAAVADTPYHLISVVDNGIGFDPQEGEKIFTMFYRLHERGKQKGGIGLAICKKIMDLHGGFIASECTPECTTFKCYFPIQKM